MTEKKLWVMYDQTEKNMLHPRDIFDKLGRKLYYDTDGVFCHHLSSYAGTEKSGYGLNFKVLYHNKAYTYCLFKTISKNINVYPLTLTYELTEDKYFIESDKQLEDTLIGLIKNPLTSNLLFKIHKNLNDDKQNNT